MNSRDSSKGGFQEDSCSEIGGTSSVPTQVVDDVIDQAGLQRASLASANREIVKKVTQLYKGNDNRKRTSLSSQKESASSRLSGLNLESIGQLLNVSNVIPRPAKATVVVVGNVSAGKSTFINWYVQELVQRTGMAAETTAVSVIIAGKRVAEIKGNTAFDFRPQYKEVFSKCPSLIDTFSILVCPSKHGRLHLVDFVDTPGISDTSEQIETLVLGLTNIADLFLVFLDPVAYASAQRLMSFVKKLHGLCPEKLRFCLTKMDDSRSEEERVKTMCQATQYLSSMTSSRAASDIVPLYIPGGKEGVYLSPLSADSTRHRQPSMNRIDDVVGDIEKMVEVRVQESLSRLDEHIQLLRDSAESEMKALSLHRRLMRAEKRQAQILRYWRSIILMIACLVGLIHLASQPGYLQKGNSTLQQYLSFQLLSSHTILVLTTFASQLSIQFFQILWTFIAVTLATTFLVGLWGKRLKHSERQDRFCRLSNDEVKQKEAQLQDAREYLRFAKKECSKLKSIYGKSVLGDSV